LSIEASAASVAHANKNATTVVVVVVWTIAITGAGSVRPTAGEDSVHGIGI